MSPGSTETISANGFTDDFLYDGTGYLKIGTRRQWGASIIFFGMSQAGPGINSSNAIDSNDTGREVQVALYDPTRILQGCAWNASCQSNPGAACPTSITYLGWNPVQGGNQCNIGSGIENVSLEPGVLEASVRPLFWNPDWEAQSCVDSGCSDPVKKTLLSDVLYTQRLRFISTHVVEMQMTVQNLSNIDHPVTHQEFPTLYAAYGKNGTSNLKVLLDSEGNQIPIDQPANDGFFVKNFSSPGGWATLQSAGLDYGVAIYYENRLTSFQGWQKSGVFNNVRSLFPFGVHALGTVRARAYLVLGNYETVKGVISELDNSLPPFGNIDSPAEDSFVGDSMALAGWVLDNKGVITLTLFIDGEEHDNLLLNTARPDVCKHYPGYAQCNQVGFTNSIDVSDLTPCQHILEIVATDTDGNSRTIVRRRFAVGDPVECFTDAECYDGNGCTIDTCLTGNCNYAPSPCEAPTHAIYRYNLATGGTDHMFGVSAEAAPGYVNEGSPFTLFDEQGPGMLPLHQLYCAPCVDHLQSASASEGAPQYVFEETLGYCAAEASESTPHALKRFFSASGSDHFVTIDTAEWEVLTGAGYTEDGVVCYTP